MVRHWLKGGRLSKRRLADHAAAINNAIGAGVAALLDPTRTLVIVKDAAVDEKQQR